MNSWDAYSESVAGRREANEDRVLTLPLGDDGYFFAVADGMGGFKGGALASSVVLAYARDFLTERFSEPVRPDQLKRILRELYAGADAAIRAEQKANPGFEGMGATLACLLAKGDLYVIGNVGDSRVYRLTEGSLQQLTVDHTYLQDMITKTGTRPDPGVVKHFSHVVTRSIQGGKDTVDIFPLEERWYRLADGDGFLLCSDGLILDKGADHESVLERHFSSAKSLKEAVEKMVSFALGSGSSDNVSVVLATWGAFRRLQDTEPETLARVPEKAVAPRRRSFLEKLSGEIVPLLVVAIILLAVLFVMRVFGQSRALSSQSESRQTPLEAAQILPEHSEVSHAWQPFGDDEDRIYRLDDELAWSAHPSGEVSYYEVRFGELPTVRCNQASCRLRDLGELQVKVPYRVTVVAVLPDGTRETGPSQVFVFR
jgi:serine/threonine protein phosphatase PrpC